MKNFISQLREERGLTLQELAQKVGTTHQQISNLEKGRRRLSWEWIQRIADALECHPLEIIEGPAAIIPKDEQEKELLKKFRGFDDSAKSAFKHMIDMYGEKPNKKD